MKVCDIRIVPYKTKFPSNSHPTYYRIQAKIVWIRIGPLVFYHWRTIGEYITYDCAVLDAKDAMKCFNNEWKENSHAQ